MEQPKSMDRTIHFPILEGAKLMSTRTGPTSGHHMIVMLPLDEATEAKLDKGKNVIMKWNNHDYLVRSKNVFVYGAVDFNDDDDIDAIYECNFQYPDSGVWVYSDYDYKTNTTQMKKGITKMYPCYNNLKIVKQYYGMLGCPEAIVIFKVYAPYINKRI